MSSPGFTACVPGCVSRITGRLFCVCYDPSHAGPAPCGGSLITLRLRICAFVRSFSRAFSEGRCRG